MSEYETLTSGEKEHFNGGAQRDSQKGKPRYDLIPPLALKRLAGLYARGADTYGESNWAAGIGYKRLYASAMRHLIQWSMGDNTEDHLSAVCFNIFAIIHFQELKREDLNDMHKWNENYNNIDK